MNLDFDLIDQNINNVNKSISRRIDLNVPWAYQINNVFTDAMIAKIKCEFLQNKNWDKIDLQENKPRQSIRWRHDSVIGEMFMIFQTCENTISKIFNRVVTMSSVNLWQDAPDYQIGPHLDNDRISIAVQIYINDAKIACGTEFYEDKKFIDQIPFECNTGYIMNNTPNSYHGMTTTGATRQSVYIIYK
jgi:hypothetical protein